MDPEDMAALGIGAFQGDRVVGIVAPGAVDGIGAKVSEIRPVFRGRGAGN
jgi:hypothetical protein